MGKEFREIEYSTKLKKAAVQQNRQFNEIKYQEDDWVFFQEKDGKAWKGPVRVHVHRGRDVFVFANGNIKKIADCKVQPYRVHEDKEEESTFRKEIDETQEEKEERVGPKTRSRSKSEREEKEDV